MVCDFITHRDRSHFLQLNIQKAGKAYHDYRLRSKAFHAETVDTILHIRRLNYRGSDRSRMN